jgi:hypothetical protein
MPLSAEVIWLSDRVQTACEPAIDLRTAVDVAIRDLREIQAHWGTELAHQRLLECQAVLRSAFDAS